VRELVDTILAAQGSARTTSGAEADRNPTSANSADQASSAARTQSPALSASSASGWESVLAAPPASESETAAVNKALQTSAVFTFIWFVLARLAVIFVRLFFGLSVSGREKLPHKGPFILSPNHQSFLDGPIVAGLMPWRLFRDMFYVGTSEIFGAGLFSFIARTLKLVPVDPDSNLVNAMRAGAWGLKQGDILVLYPEGERSIDGTPKRFKKGAAILSTHLQVPTIPVALEGFYTAWPRNQKLPRRARLQISFGDAIPPPPPPGSASSAEATYKQLTEELRNRVVEMWETMRKKETSPEPVAVGD
jgi:long-chain acyl-CoA synthetase